MTDTIKIKEVDSSDPKLLDFAKSFGHDIDPRFRTLVAEQAKTGEWLGYLQIINQPSTISGWKRPGLDTIKAIKAMDKVCAENGIGIAWCHQDSPLYDKMTRLGFQKSGLEVFYSLPKGGN
jgi:hypothetical protein